MIQTPDPSKLCLQASLNFLGLRCSLVPTFAQLHSSLNLPLKRLILWNSLVKSGIISHGGNGRLQTILHTATGTPSKETRLRQSISVVLKVQNEPINRWNRVTGFKFPVDLLDQLLCLRSWDEDERTRTDMWRNRKIVSNLLEICMITRGEDLQIPRSLPELALVEELTGH